MSLYCIGTGCDKKDDCCTYIEGKEMIEGGFENGVWFMDKKDCDEDGNKFFYSYKKLKDAERRLAERTEKILSLYEEEKL